MSNYVTTTSDKSKKTALIVCALLGVFGGHQFYVGKTIKHEDIAFSGNLPKAMVKLIITSDRGFHMKKENIPFDVRTIRGAVAGESWAVEKVVEHYSGRIDRLCSKTERQADGSVKKVVDEDMRQSLILKLIEALPQFKAEL